MSEYKIQFKEFGKLISVAIFALLYALGGIHNTWIRRIIAPLWLSGAMFFFTRNWRALLQAPLLMIGLRLGYGSDVVIVKILKRALYGGVNGLTAIVLNRGLLFWVHLILCIGLTVFFGVFNPFGSARAEELIIGFIIGFLPMYMLKDKE